MNVPREVGGAQPINEVARFKMPEHLVLVDQLATTKVGKIDKKALRADIVERLAAAAPA